NGLILLMTCSQPGMISVGYRAEELKNKGIVMAWPMPMRRSLATTTPASDIDRQQKTAEPTATMTSAAISFSGLSVNDTPSSVAMIKTTTPWITERTPEANG